MSNPTQGQCRATQSGRGELHARTTFDSADPQTHHHRRHAVPSPESVHDDRRPRSEPTGALERTCIGTTSTCEPTPTQWDCWPAAHSLSCSPAQRRSRSHPGVPRFSNELPLWQCWPSPLGTLAAVVLGGAAVPGAQGPLRRCSDRTPRHGLVTNRPSWVPRSQPLRLTARWRPGSGDRFDGEGGRTQGVTDRDPTIVVGQVMDPVGDGRTRWVG